MTREHLAYHEAGHALIALIGSPPTPVYSASIIEIDGGFVKHAVARTWEMGLAIQLAGRVGEILGGAHVSTHPGSDTEEAIELCREAGIPVDAIPATCRACEADVEKLLRRHRGWLDRVADALLERGRLNGLDVLRLKPGETQPSQALEAIVDAWSSWRDPAVVEREREARETRELLADVDRLLVEAKRRRTQEQRT